MECYLCGHEFEAFEQLVVVHGKCSISTVCKDCFLDLALDQFNGSLVRMDCDCSHYHDPSFDLQDGE